jgi:hypothetical protein
MKKLIKLIKGTTLIEVMIWVVSSLIALGIYSYVSTYFGAID